MAITREDVLELYASGEDLFSVHVEILARLEIDEVDVALYEWITDADSSPDHTHEE